MQELGSLISLASPPGGNIRAVVFDAVGTVMYAMPSVTAVYCDLLGQLSGTQVDSGRVRSVLAQRLASRSESRDLTTDESAEREFWFSLIAELVADTARQQQCFDALYDHFGRAENWRCYDDVADSVECLRRQGLQVVIASNFDERLHRVCEGLNGLRPVTDRIISSEVGWRKPARQFFEVVCQRTNCRPEEVLFVGDDPHNDIHGARLSGMPAVWIDRRSEPPGAVGSAGPPTVSERVWRIGSLLELC